MPIPAGSEAGATSLASRADVEAELGRVLSFEESDKVDAALASASDYVRTETRRKFAAGTYTVTRKVRGGKVRLDSPADVTGVVAVDSLGNPSDLTGWTLRGNTLYGLGYACDVEVTYTSTGAVPDDLRRVVAAMAARDITSEAPVNATAHSWTEGPFGGSASYDEPSDPALPSTSEARTIAKYANRAGSVSLL